MNYKILIGFQLIFNISIVFAGEKLSVYTNFDDNIYLTSEIRKEIKPYLLPLKHPAKRKLDKIFSKQRATHDDTSLVEAGFEIISSRPTSKIRVVKHSKLPGYLIKLYLDTSVKTLNKKPEWFWFVQRCNGAQQIGKIIKKENMQHFTVSKKWIYPLPVNPSPRSSALKRQLVVLLVKDMHILSDEESRLYWLHHATKDILNELYKILKSGYGSCYLSGNVPFSLKFGKFAFIDTEKPKHVFDLPSVKNFLNAEMADYWDELIRTNP